MRKYIPMDFINNGMIPGNNLFCVFNAELYHFGVLTSNVHMAWTKTVCGYFGPSYRYSSDIVYNNFPWCKPTLEQAERITRTAQGILDARNLYPECSLADLYDELTMPPERRLHHLINIKKCRIFAPFSNAEFHLNTRFIGYVHNLYHRCC
ncbi:MAG: hypothetical protein K2K02_08580 [Ruminococcus sp.]|nr:hypothetical protein [Ruminococcus sp.]